ncbi:Lactosylceramide alpha-2,3-sialyltransferase [Manis javanica]|nr:Lactosylceramide alpha-2,3-sialyltransferase [Manis javanica]
MQAKQDDHLAGMVLEDPSKEKLRTENEHEVKDTRFGLRLLDSRVHAFNDYFEEHTVPRIIRTQSGESGIVLEGSEFMNRYRKNMKLGVDHEVKLFSCWNHFLSRSLN